MKTVKRSQPLLDAQGNKVKLRPRGYYKGEQGNNTILSKFAQFFDMYSVSLPGAAWDEILANTSVSKLDHRYSWTQIMPLSTKRPNMYIEFNEDRYDKLSHRGDIDIFKLTPSAWIKATARQSSITTTAQLYDDGKYVAPVWWFREYKDFTTHAEKSALLGKLLNVSKIKIMYKEFPDVKVNFAWLKESNPEAYAAFIEWVLTTAPDGRVQWVNNHE